MAFVQCFTVICIIYTTLSLVGYEFRWILTKTKFFRFSHVEMNALLGLAFVQLICWYRLDTFGGGLSSTLGILLTICIVLGIVLGIMNSKNLWKTINSNIGLLATLAAGTVVFLIQWYPLLKMGFVTATGTNADISAYALVAQHIEHHSFHEIGKIGLKEFTALPKQDVSGAYFFVIFARHITRTQFYEVLIPAIGAAQLMLTHALYKLLQTVVKLPLALIILLSIFPQTTFMFRYLSGNFFLAQILAMAAMVSLLTLFLETRNISPSREIKSLRFGQWGVIPVVILLLTYPHMAFVVPPLLALIVFPSVPKENRARFIRSISVIGFVSIVLLFEKFTVAFDRMKDLALDRVNGWPLPGFLPSQLLGIQWSSLRAPSLSDGLFSVVLMVLFISSSLLNRASKTWFPSMSILLWTGTTYAYFYFSSGPSYRQWKWITFFQPIVLIAILVPIFLALLAKSESRKYISVALPLALLIFVAGNIARTFDYASEITESHLVVTKKIVTLANESSLKTIPAVNIKSGAYLGSMWPAYFVPSHSVNILDESYFTSTEPLEAPTLVSENFVVDPGVEFETLKSGHKLVEFPKKNSTAWGGLAASISVKSSTLKIGLEAEVTVSGEARNDGENSWLGSGLLNGSVNVGARAISHNGKRVNLEMARAELTTFPNFVGPGETRNFQLTLSFNKPGKYLLEITPVSEGVSWFSELNSRFAHFVEVNVSE